MACDLGFKPTNNANYYFLSYNSEDSHRISEISRLMFHSGINVWYDKGIGYGEKWEKIIAEKINACQAVILFFTKGILSKDNSYVEKEYKMASKFKREVYTVMLDDIDDRDVPVNKMPWWIEITDRQCIAAHGSIEPYRVVEEISALLGVTVFEDKMDKIIEKYNDLYLLGRRTEAEECLAQYLHGISLKGKAKLITNMQKGAFKDIIIQSTADTIKGRLEKPLFIHTNMPKDSFYECKRIVINQDTFTLGNDYLFHRGSRGDAHVIWLWRNDEMIFVIGGLVEADGIDLFYDSYDDIIYISYISDQETMDEEKGLVVKSSLSIAAIEDPNGEAVGTDFRFIGSE